MTTNYFQSKPSRSSMDLVHISIVNFRSSLRINFRIQPCLSFAGLSIFNLISNLRISFKIGNKPPFWWMQVGLKVQFGYCQKSDQRGPFDNNLKVQFGQSIKVKAWQLKGDIWEMFPLDIFPFLLFHIWQIITQVQ